jgi:hypothetical protein
MQLSERMPRRRPSPMDLSRPEQASPAEVQRRIQAGEWVVDSLGGTAGDIRKLAGAGGLRSYRVSDFAGHADRIGHQVAIVNDEYQAAMTPNLTDTAHPSR